MRVFFKTFGCRSNLFDTQVMMANLRGYEIVSDENLADIIVVNSCTVTNGADSGVQSYINRFRDSKKRIYFTGCGAGSKGRENYDKNLAFGVFPHSLKEDVSALLAKNQRFFYAEEQPLHIDSTIVSEFVGKTRAFIKIQEGCDFACSYCIIPSVRGGARSFPKAAIIRQVERLLDSGVSEIILTGTNVGSYGKDLGDESIASLIESLFKLQGLKRLRVGSLEPSQISEEFLNLTQEPLFEKHLHILVTYQTAHQRSGVYLHIYRETAVQASHSPPVCRSLKLYRRSYNFPSRSSIHHLASDERLGQCDSSMQNYNQQQ